MASIDLMHYICIFWWFLSGYNDD